MEEGDYAIDPFSSEDLWRLSEFTLQSLQPLEPLPWNEELSDLTGLLFKNPLNLFDEDSKLHQLDICGDDLVEPEQLLEPITDTSSESHAEASTGDADNDVYSLGEDIGLLDRLNDEFDTTVPLRSWETYQNRLHDEPVSVYFSESGAKGFDAALAHAAKNRGARNGGRLVKKDVFLQALIRLGLGWSSAFFQYNKEEEKFDKTLDDVHVSGISSPVFSQIIDEMLQYGTDMQRVRAFVRKTTAKAVELSAISTFSSAAAVIIHTLERQLATRSQHTVSLLQIKTLFSRGGELASAIANMVNAVEESSSDAQVMTVVMGKAAYLTERFGWIEKLMREIVIRVTEPWLGYLEAWVGFRPETSVLSEQVASGKSFAVLERHEDDGRIKSGVRVDYKYQPEQMPSFIPADQALLMFESGRSLRLLRRSHPRHPLAYDVACHVSEPPRFCYADSWLDIERIQNKAREYEDLLRVEILKYNSGERNLDICNDSGIATHTNHNTFDDTYELYDMEDEKHVTGLLTNQESTDKDRLGQLSSEIEPVSYDEKFGPELASSLYLSLGPLLSSQALLIDFSCLHLLFKEHGLRNHLTLQWRFQLLGDGFFTSRLSNALFDPEMESGERKSGVVRSGVHTGLRLGSRDTWPPASSELRLVLIGLLSESQSAAEGTANLEDAQHHRERELPGGLSFAVRELSAEEITKCKDPNAIQALDFLRLQYKPPGVLEIIITQRSLNKYDLLFKHFLRLVRMNSVVKALVRDSTAGNSFSGDTRNIFQRFRIDAQHFILALSDYCFHVGVGSTWRRFQDTLSQVEYCLDRGDVDGTIDAAHSVPRLRDYHEEILEGMLFALFLSKRHAQVATLLENTFGTILHFAPISKMDGDGVRQESVATVAQLYSTFRKQVSAFVEYLRGLDGGKGSKSAASAGTPRSGPMSIFDHLLVRLDMNGYY